MTRKQRRATFIAVIFAVLALSVTLILQGLKENIVFFNSPTDVQEKNIQPQKAFRLGGLVEAGSVKRNGTITVFNVSDGKTAQAVQYKGILPDLFREGQGVVCEGALDASRLFVATTVLAKHDENYMPKEVVDALKKQGKWQEPKKEGGAK